MNLFHFFQHYHEEFSFFKSEETFRDMIDRSHEKCKQLDWLDHGWFIQDEGLRNPKRKKDLEKFWFEESLNLNEMPHWIKECTFEHLEFDQRHSLILPALLHIEFDHLIKMRGWNPEQWRQEFGNPKEPPYSVMTQWWVDGKISKKAGPSCQWDVCLNPSSHSEGGFDKVKKKVYFRDTKNLDAPDYEVWVKHGNQEMQCEEQSWTNKEGQYHRKDGPARITPQGKFYYEHGNMHRLDGPAAVLCRQDQEECYWYLGGKAIKKEDHPGWVKLELDKTIQQPPSNKLNENESMEGDKVGVHKTVRVRL